MKHEKAAGGMDVLGDIFSCFKMRSALPVASMLQGGHLTNLIFSTVQAEVSLNEEGVRAEGDLGSLILGRLGYKLYWKREEGKGIVQQKLQCSTAEFLPSHVLSHFKAARFHPCLTSQKRVESGFALAVAP